MIGDRALGAMIRMYAADDASGWDDWSDAELVEAGAEPVDVSLDVEMDSDLDVTAEAVGENVIQISTTEIEDTSVDQEIGNVDRETDVHMEHDHSVTIEVDDNWSDVSESEWHDAISSDWTDVTDGSDTAVDSNLYVDAQEGSIEVDTTVYGDDDTTIDAGYDAGDTSVDTSVDVDSGADLDADY
ncbi:hypothetical protein JW859_05490 [bacterium]|nr:hypothetical protein [bacterium]